MEIVDWFNITGKDLGCYNQFVRKIGLKVTTEATNMKTGKREKLTCQVIANQSGK